jgi:hypothetical protein
MPAAWTTPVLTFHSGRKTFRKIIGFWHIGALGDWQRIVAEQYSRLKDSGLHAASEKLVVGFIGGAGRESELTALTGQDPKLDVFTTEDLADYEFPTLTRVWREAQISAEPFLCYYMHTKGASVVDPDVNEAVNAWRRYMEYFNIERWPDCAAILKNYDTCGVELQSEDSHYSGNFWWATSDYLRRLPDGQRYWQQHRHERVAAEFYLCQACPRAYCFSDFVENLYDYALPAARYRR